VVARRLYRPYGETRTVTGTLTTAYAFTGQVDEAGLGLVYMHARWYAPALMRWTQPDTIVPNPGDPQGLDRYSYVLDNPLRHTDPTGHITNDPTELSAAHAILSDLLGFGVVIFEDWGWRWVGDESGQGAIRFWDPGSWRLDELQVVQQAVHHLSEAVGGPEAFYESMGGPVYVLRMKHHDLEWYACKHIYPRVSAQALTDLWRIKLYDEWASDPNREATVVHELAHVWDASPMASENIGGFVGDERRPTPYADTNRKEHWAESVEWCLYPNANANVGPLHQQYVALAVSGQFPGLPDPGIVRDLRWWTPASAEEE